MKTLTALTLLAASVGFAQDQLPGVTIPAGSVIRVRLNESISTKQNRAGDRFDGVVENPIEVDGRIAIHKGALVHGVVREAKPSGRFKGRAEIMLALQSIDVDGHAVPIRTSSATSRGRSHKKRNLALIGGGAGTGALIGAAAGGGVGAAVGAGVGATAGFTGAVITGKKQLRIPAETVVSFRLAKSATV